MTPVKILMIAVNTVCRYKTCKYIICIQKIVFDTYYMMNRAMIENNIRQLCQKVGIVGARGPMPGWILPVTITAIILMTFVLILMVKIYQMMTDGSCIMCGKKHP